MYKTTYERTLASGGGTFDPTSFADVTYGYAVGIHDGTYAIVRPNDRIGYSEAVLRLTSDYPDALFGTWINSDDGLIYIDPVAIYDFEEDAAAQSRQNNQIAYYIIHEQREVRL